MCKFVLLTMAGLAAGSALLVRATDSSQSDAERYIRSSESQWAEAVASHDASVAQRILADDFVGVAPNGSHYSKADDIAENKRTESEFKSNHLVNVNVRFYDSAAVAQGSEAWERRNGQRGRFIWTDTWIRRNGKWQVVAAEDIAVPEPEK